MRIAVLGGEGVVGRHVVDEARRRGHEAISLSRSSGVDVSSGDGLDEALVGADVAIDVTNIASLRRHTALRYFESSSKHLQSAALRCAVGHVVVLSIVGIDQVRAVGYYDAKVTQERLHLDGPVPATVLRATQFHEFALQVASRATAAGVALVPSIRVQTVAARSVAEQLVDAAAAGPHRGRLADVAGPPPPGVLADRTRAAFERAGRRTKVVSVPPFGSALEGVREGALLPAADATITGPSFEAWLDGPDGPATTDGSAAA